LNLAKQEQENIIFGEYDPSQVVTFLNKFSTTALEGVITVPLKRANISSLHIRTVFPAKSMKETSSSILERQFVFLLTVWILLLTTKMQ
jgi:hypothetical protein